MDFHIPNLANGTFVPMEVQLREAKERELRKKQRRHDFLVTLFSVVNAAADQYRIFGSVLFSLIPFIAAKRNKNMFRAKINVFFMAFSLCFL